MTRVVVGKDCPIKGCDCELVTAFPPMCNLHYQLVPFAMAADLTMGYRYGAKKQPKVFRDRLEKAIKYVDELIMRLVDIHGKDSTMGHHLTPDKKFKSDKYPWCPVGYFALSFEDRGAWSAIREYALSTMDLELREDLLEALKEVGATI